MTTREEVFNVTLADMLTGRGGAIRAEQRSGDHAPDGQGDWHGVRTVIECKYEAPGAAAEVEDQIDKRLQAGYGPLGVIVLYPAEWRNESQPASALLTSGSFKVRFCLRDGRQTRWISVAGFDEFTRHLNAARFLFVSDADLSEAVAGLTALVDEIARAFENQPGYAEELVRLVTAANPISGSQPTSEELDAARKVGALTIGTALLLQHHLAPLDTHVPRPPRMLQSASSVKQELSAAWQKVLTYNYRSVFSVAAAVLDTFDDEPALDAALRSAIERTSHIVARRALGRHDLIGRVYHTLLSSQKYLATYFTSVPAASLLAAVALSPSRWPEVDWGAEDPGFSIADPACGTGTLLASAVTVAQQNHIDSRARANQPIDLPKFSARLIEDHVFGFDILAYAVQVAAAHLLLSAPATALMKGNMVQMPFGGQMGSLGSLDFLASDSNEATGTLFDGIGTLHTVDEETPGVAITLPEVDLVIMNPPFTRSNSGSRLLGSLPESELERARTRLALIGRRDAVAVGTKAGLGALFLPLAARMLRPGGRAAFVLPKALLTGKDWEPARKLLSSQFALEVVIASHEPDQWNFSDSTSLAEVLVVARKRVTNEPARDCLWINLTENPDNAVEALGIASALERLGESATESALYTGGGRYSQVGSVTRRPAPDSPDGWTHAVFASGDLDLVAHQLVERGPIRLPRVKASVQIPLVALGDVATFGKDVRDVRDAFEEDEAVTPYPALWGNKSELVGSVAHTANTHLKKRTEAAPGRPLLDGDTVWATAGRLMIANRPRFTTNRASAVLLPSAALGSTWWPVTMADADEAGYQLVAMWLNSILGLLAYTLLGEETEGPLFNIKKNKMLRMPVPDFASLGRVERRRVREAWTATSGSPLLPLSQAATDPSRQKFDLLIADLFGVSKDGLDAVRQVWSAERRFQAPRRAEAQVPEDLAATVSLFEGGLGFE